MTEMPDRLADKLADRHNVGKVRFDLIPLSCLEGMARVLQKAAEGGKYDTWNWLKGQRWSTPMASMLRHISAIQKGEMTDPESGELHIDHVLTNAMFLSHYMKEFKELNDLPKTTREKREGEDQWEKGDTTP